MTTNKPKELPILFQDDMVRAILQGRKTVTRRVVKPPRGWADESPSCDPFAMPPAVWWWNGVHELVGVRQECPYGQPGDRLWVRESTEEDCAGSVSLSRYRADGAPVLYSGCDDPAFNGSVAHWNYPRRVRPSIHLPRWASRITLEITDVRVERLQGISEGDARAEGVQEMRGGYWRNYQPGWTQHQLSAKGSFATLWGSINGPDSWDANPWVWVVEFRRVDQ